jgi:hypothetical protein
MRFYHSPACPCNRRVIVIHLFHFYISSQNNPVNQPLALIVFTYLKHVSNPPHAPPRVPTPPDERAPQSPENRKLDPPLSSTLQLSRHSIPCHGGVKLLQSACESDVREDAIRGTLITHYPQPPRMLDPRSSRLSNRPSTRPSRSRIAARLTCSRHELAE